MSLKPAEILMLLECALVAVFALVFKIPFLDFFRFLTNLRGGGIHWLTLVTGLEISLLPVLALLVRSIFKQLSFLHAAVQSDSGSPELSIRLSEGWKEEGRAVLRGLTLLRDWLPLLVFMGIYWTAFSLSEHLRMPLRDSLLAQWDLALFGSHYSVTAQKLYCSSMTAFMDFSYFMHTVILPMFLCLLYLQKRLVLFDRTLLFILLCGTIAACGYVLVPAYGPYVYLRNLYTMDLVRNPFIATFVDVARSPKDAFPSLHVALSSGLLIYQYRYAKWLFWLLLPLVAGNWLSTIYLRYHYSIDLLAGFAVAGIAYGITEFIHTLYETKRKIKIG